MAGHPLSRRGAANPISTLRWTADMLQDDPQLRVERLLGEDTGRAPPRYALFDDGELVVQFPARVHASAQAIRVWQATGHRSGTGMIPGETAHTHYRKLAIYLNGQNIPAPKRHA